uniref:G protein-coupled receptor n=1 Tax=Pristionchus pacificus TaxID=54126 RepID=A0A8R1YZC6_PRIPA
MHTHVWADRSTRVLDHYNREMIFDRMFIVRSVHLLVTIPAIILNSALLFCMFKRKIINNGSFEIIIKFHCFFDLISSIVGFLSMVRLIPIGWSAIFFSYGPCSLISSSFCFFSFALFLYSDTIATYFTLLSFITRFYIIKYNCLSRERVLFLLSYSFPLPTTTISSPDNLIRVFNVSKLFGNYNGNIRRMILSLLKQSILRASGKTIATHRTFVRMLTFQALLPIVLLLTVISLLIGLFNFVHNPNIETSTMIFAELVPIGSPFIVFWHIPVYRKELMRLFPPKETVSVVYDLSVGGVGSAENYERME